MGEADVGATGEEAEMTQEMWKSCWRIQIFRKEKMGYVVLAPVQNC